MKHLSEEDLVLTYFDEAPSELAEHVRDCRSCRRRLEELAAVMDATRTLRDVPDPEPDYGHQVWQRLEPQLVAPEPTPEPETRTPFWKEWFEGWRRPEAGNLGWAMATVILVVGAFVLGRLGAPPPPQVAVATADGADRVLLVALGVHLERSRVLFLELANSDTPNTLELADLAPRASRLLGDNRLYRLAAEAAGDRNIAAALGEIERLLIDLRHLEPGDAAFADVRQRLNRRGLLVKLEALATDVQTRRNAPWTSQPSIGDDDHATSV